MTKKRKKRPPRAPRRPKTRPTRRRPAAGPTLVTPEGDLLVLVHARYRHTAMAEIDQILREAGDFDTDDDLEAGKTLQFDWFETGPGTQPPPAPLGRRILANVTLTPETLEIETMSEQRLGRCRRRLKTLLGHRIRFLEKRTKSVEQALSEPPPEDAPEPLILPPEVVAEMEERMLREWMDDSIPALGGMTPREAAKTPQGRQMLLDLLDYIERQQASMPPAPGMFSPDYRKVIKMLGLE